MSYYVGAMNFTIGYLKNVLTHDNFSEDEKHLVNRLFNNLIEIGYLTKDDLGLKK